MSYMIDLSSSTAGTAPMGWTGSLERRRHQQLELLSYGADKVPLVICPGAVTTRDITAMNFSSRESTDTISLYAAIWNVSRGAAATKIIAHSPVLLEAVRSGEADAKAGDFVSWDEVFGED